LTVVDEGIQVGKRKEEGELLNDSSSTGRNCILKKKIAAGGEGDFTNVVW
jgi:hypothetical protein